jgi:hypothetical protein
MGFVRRTPAAHGGPLHPSGAAKTDRHLAVFDDHRHVTAAFAVDEHALERRRILLDVQILDRDAPPIKVFTGGLRVGSSVLAED